MNLMGYNKVYQGGHHDVWCNGNIHLVPHFVGGTCYPALDPTQDFLIKRVYPCNCAAFKPVGGDEDEQLID